MTIAESRTGRRPGGIAVIGGGRWARVLVDALCGVVPAPEMISVHSRHNAAAMSSWAGARGEGRIRVASDWPEAAPGAVIVANAAKDHEAAVEWAIRAGSPVLVEKPMAMSYDGARRLVDLARDGDVRLAPALVFRFARYFERFAQTLRAAGPVEALEIEWTDPRTEVRYGEQKLFDPSLPVFADLLPHVVCIIGTVLFRLPEECRGVRTLRGGAVELDLIAAGIPCTVRMARNADRRRRMLRARLAGGDAVELDHSVEPGSIVHRGTSVVADPGWDSALRPLPSMLSAFLAWAGGGERDPRLDLEPGLVACRITDQTLELQPGPRATEAET